MQEEEGGRKKEDTNGSPNIETETDTFNVDVVLVHVIMGVVTISSRAMTRTEVMSFFRSAVPGCNGGITDGDRGTSSWAQLHIMIGAEAPTTSHRNATVVHRDWRSAGDWLFGWVMSMGMMDNVWLEILDVDDAVL